MSQETHNKIPSETEFDDLCRMTCEGYPPDYIGSVEEVGELLNRICWKLHYWRNPDTVNSYHPLGDPITGPLYDATLDLYMKDAPFNYRAIARKRINEALGRTDA